jgi:peroxiredoxin family protein
MAAVMEAPAASEATTPKPVDDRLVIFACSGDLERTWATYILASTGAAMGKEVTVFCTFWGLFPLVREDAGQTGENWMQKMLSTMNRGGTEHLKLSKMNFAGMGPAMMRSIASSHNISQPTELRQLAIDMGVKFVPCQMTMDMMGLKREDLIDGVDEPAGATSALLAATGATTLFI